MENSSTIIPVASGKGGVGKTFLTANVAMALAQRGHKTIAVDMDLGGSNLHSFLGLPNRYPGIGDFLKAKTADLEELLVSTAIPNLQFLPGDGRSPFMANIPHGQKQKLIRRIQALPAEFVLLDLGSGTTFNTLDVFRLSAHGLVVTTLEYPSIMNMLTFLKLVVLREIEKRLKHSSLILDELRSFYNQPISEDQKDIVALQERIAAIDEASGNMVLDVCKRYRPRILFNRGYHPDEMKISGQIDSALEGMLSLKADYFGFVFEDQAVREVAKKRIAFLPAYPDTIVAKSMGRIADRIINYWKIPVEGSAELLLKSTQKLVNREL